MNTTSDLLVAIIDALDAKGPGDNGNYAAKCPFHDDTRASLSIHPEKGFKCHTETCGETGSIKKLYEKVTGSVSATPTKKQNNNRKISAVYRYENAAGDLLYEVVRTESKQFYQQKPHPENPNSRVKSGIPEPQRVLYNLPALTKSDKSTPVIITEGEKDADNLNALGFLATTNAMGAGKWLDHYGRVLEGHPIIIMSDNDQAGLSHARKVAASLYKTVASVRIVTEHFEATGNKGDITDWIEQGRTKQDVIDLIKRTPRWSPQHDPAWEDPWPVWTMKQAYEDRPPVQWIVSGVLSIPSLSVVYGAPGSMKSLLMLDLCGCVVSGSWWLIPPPNGTGTGIETKQASVLWIDLDNGKRRTHDRVAAIGRAYDLGDNDGLFYVSMPSPWFDASNDAHVQDLRTRILKYDIKLVVIDNLSAIRGNVEENSAEMIRVMQPLRQLSESTGSAIVVLHHETKGQADKPGGKLRGHSAINGAIDLALSVYRDERSRFVSLTATKVREVEVPPIGAEFTYDWKDGTKDLYSARFWGASVHDKGGDDAVMDAIIQVIAEKQPVLREMLVKTVKSRTNAHFTTIGLLLDQMVKNDVVWCQNQQGMIKFQLPVRNAYNN